MDLLELSQNTTVLALLALWTLPWKGVALWKAARHKHTKWFVAVLIINTLGLLEILYIYVFSKPKWHGAKETPEASDAKPEGEVKLGTEMPKHE